MPSQMQQIQITDFSGGLCTNHGALSLSANQSPDCLNVFGFPGRLQYRGGYIPFSALPFECDAAYEFYDATKNRHMMRWAGGNLYDVTTGSPVVIAPGVYTPGEQVGRTVLNGIMYWATLTVPLRQYDGTTEMQTPNTGGAGVVAPPAANFLTTYAGSIIAVAPVYSGVPLPSAFGWCNVNDPTKWVGANIQTVGSNDGGLCTFAIPMGISQVGVSPTRQFLVGKTTRNLFLYEGALSVAPGALIENQVSCPVGSLDPNSAVYIPTQQGLGAVMFLGSDGQFWQTNGVEARVMSLNIQNVLYAYVRQSLVTRPTQKFNAAYFDRYQYYICDMGQNIQFVYQWQTDSWWLFTGWPSGPFTTTTDLTGLPALYMSAAEPGTTGVYQVALDQVDDNGVSPEVYYMTPFLHGGKPEMEKDFQWAVIETYDIGVTYAVTGFSLPDATNAVQQTNVQLFQDSSLSSTTSSAAMIWDVDKWDEALWGGGFSTSSQPYTINIKHGRLNVPFTGSRWIPAGEPQPLRSGAAQFKIARNSDAIDFQLLGFTCRYFEISQAFPGGNSYQTEGRLSSTVDPYTTTSTNPAD